MLPKWLTAESQGEEQGSQSQSRPKAASATPKWAEKTEATHVHSRLPDWAR